uniref:Uncharacterized protein n=1 Tax=Anopheles culicifacies TaxID=139723 RepID=A0A182MDS7_9DIPT
MTTGEELRRSRQCFERDVVCRMLHKTSKQCCLRPIVRPRELESIVSTPVPPSRTLSRIGDPSCTGVKVPVSISTPLNIKYLLATAIHQREWLRFGLSSPISSSSSVIIIMIVGMAGRVPVYQTPMLIGIFEGVFPELNGKESRRMSLMSFNSGGVASFVQRSVWTSSAVHSSNRSRKISRPERASRLYGFAVSTKQRIFRCIFICISCVPISNRERTDRRFSRGPGW